MKSKYIKELKILEVNPTSIVVQIELDTREMVSDFLGYANNITEIIKQLAKNMGKKE